MVWWIYLEFQNVHDFLNKAISKPEALNAVRHRSGNDIVNDLFLAISISPVRV